MKSSGNARSTPTGDESSPDIGPESRAATTLQAWMLHGFNSTAMTGEGTARAAEPAEIARSLDSQGGFATFQGGNLISSAEDSPAKTSPSPVDEQDSTESDPACSSSSPESLTLFSPMGDGSSLRTYPDSFHPTVDEISPSFSRRWPNSGFTTSPGECWTADTSECPSGGGAYSSLPDVLEAEVHPRFYLSPKAAAGILRRAEKRGRELPQALAKALQTLASATQDGEREMTKTSSKPMMLRGDLGGGLKDDTWTLNRHQPAETSHRIPLLLDSSVRRLTPTECERLQGFPDGHTIVED